MNRLREQFLQETKYKATNVAGKLTDKYAKWLENYLESQLSEAQAQLVLNALTAGKSEAREAPTDDEIDIMYPIRTSSGDFLDVNAGRREAAKAMRDFLSTQKPEGGKQCRHHYIQQDMQWKKCDFCGDIRPVVGQ